MLWHHHKKNFDPLGQPAVPRPVGISAFAHIVRSFVRLSVSPLFKSNITKQKENNVRYWRDYGPGRVDHRQKKNFL